MTNDNQPADYGQKPELIWVPVSDLHIDHDYQRQVSTKAGCRVIRRLSKSFHWSRFQPITISRRDLGGGYWVIDGQHRMLAAREMGLDEIPACLVQLDNKPEQASAFVDINSDRVKINVLAIHHAQVVSGDKMACRIKFCCDKAGVSIPRYPKMTGLIKPHESMAIGTMKVIILKYGDDALIWALRLLRTAYSDDAGMLVKENISYLAMIYNKYQDYYIKEDALIKAIVDMDIEQNRFIARRNGCTGNAVHTVIVHAIIRAYNKLMPVAKHLPLNSKEVVVL